MKILHLYYDIMNLYGEYGNICALMRMLEKNHIDVEVDKYSIGDKIDIMDYDMVYVGAGTEKHQKMVLEDLKKQVKAVRNFIEEGRILLMTGNSFEILGERIFDSMGKAYKGLSIFSFTVEESNVRQTSDVIFISDDISDPIVGFVNKCSKLQGIDSPLFKVERGIGNEGQGGFEGIRCQNFFGTYVTGPVLVKNPAFLLYITRCLLANRKKYDAEFNIPEELDDSWMEREKAGYHITLENLHLSSI